MTSLLKILLISNIDPSKYQQFIMLNSLPFILCPIVLSKNLFHNSIKVNVLPFIWAFILIYIIPLSLVVSKILKMNMVLGYLNYAYLVIFLTFLLNIRPLITLFCLSISFGLGICYILKIKFIFNEFFELLTFGIISYLIGIVFKNKYSILQTLTQIIYGKKQNASLGNPEGRKKGLSLNSKNKAIKAMKLYNSGELLVTDICNKIGISRGTFYRYLKYFDSEQKLNDKET